MIGEVNETFVLFNVSTIGSNEITFTGMQAKVMSFAACLGEFINTADDGAGERCE